MNGTKNGSDAKLVVGPTMEEERLIRQLVSSRERFLASSPSHHQAAHSTRMRSKSNFARPYLLRLINFKRFTAPSTCPWLHFKLNPARTAASSRSSPLAKLTNSATALF